MRKLATAWPGLVLALALTLPAAAQDWRPIGLMRVRDMTPFGIVRLDLLPAHAVPATRGTWAVEANVSYQNTYIVSDNVSEYLKSRGDGRIPLTRTDIDAILALPDDAYYVDGELGLLDLTVHYRFSEHVGLYATLPYYFFDGGYLDSAIEGFHEEFGFSSANRDLVQRNSFFVVSKIGDTKFVIDITPESDEIGDPVFGLRYSLFAHPTTWNVILEGAAKIASGSDQRLITSGSNDYGLQATAQRFFHRQALYASLGGVFYDNPDENLNEDLLIPTLIAGYERRLTRRTNAILQLYASRSVVQNTTVEELTADKYQLTLGLQSWRGNSVWRFGITENIRNFGNTPDIGLIFSVAQVVPGR
jgi:Protein of unknown function (DUF3187)